MLKNLNTDALKGDLRKLALACLIGSLTGLFLNPYHKLIALGALTTLGVALWYIGLRKWGKNRD